MPLDAPVTMRDPIAEVGEAGHGRAALRRAPRRRARSGARARRASARCAAGAARGSYGASRRSFSRTQVRASDAQRDVADLVRHLHGEVVAPVSGRRGAGARSAPGRAPAAPRRRRAGRGTTASARAGSCTPRCAAQLEKKRMCRASSCMTPSKIVDQRAAGRSRCRPRCGRGRRRRTSRSTRRSPCA